MSEITKLEGGRAAYAYKAVKDVFEKNKNHSKEYKSLVRKIGSMIQTNGLGAALAFMYAKNKDHHQLLNKHLSNWLTKESSLFKLLLNDEKLVEQVIKLDSDTYRACTVEVLALVVWLKRFAEGMIES